MNTRSKRDNSRDITGAWLLRFAGYVLLFLAACVAVQALDVAHLRVCHHYNLEKSFLQELLSRLALRG